MVVDHTVGGSGERAAVRWYEIRNPSTAPFVAQQGTYSPDAQDRWLGSVDIDRFGNIALEYNLSSSSISPELHLTAHLVGDPPGVMGAGDAVLASGQGWHATDCWGDYADVTVDPADDCTFWATGEYMAGQWGRTRITAFRLAPCPRPCRHAALTSASRMSAQETTSTIRCCS